MRPGGTGPITGYEVDFVWRETGLIIEIDTYATHGSRTAFERDRARGTHLSVLGFRVVRFTDRGVRRRPAAVADSIRRLLAQRPRAGAHAPRSISSTR